MFQLISLFIVNLVLFFIIYKLFKIKGLIIQFGSGRWWLTWFSIALITFIIELSSIFFAPAEIFRSIGLNAFFFIIVSYIFYHYLTSRFVEISEIMENNGIKNGGIYAFSNFVVGKNLSFLIVSSLLVTYLLTACISSVSAVENNIDFFSGNYILKLIVSIFIIWGVAFINILGIKILPRVIFIIFLAFAFIIINFLMMGIFSVDVKHLNIAINSFTISARNFWDFNFFRAFTFFIFGLSICSLSFNSLESVISNFNYAKNWKVIGRAYSFLFAIGLFIPILAWTLFSHKIDISQHYGNFLPYYFYQLSSPAIGYVVGIIACSILVVVVNFSFIAFNDLLEKISRKFNFNWFLKTNKRSSFFRIHLIFAILCTLIIIILNGSQPFLVEMLALAILSNLCLIMGNLLIYRYFRGTRESTLFHTSRFGTLLIFIITLSCIIFLSIDKIFLSLFWIIVTATLFVIGSKIASRFIPKTKDMRVLDNPMELVFHLSEKQINECNIYFTRDVENLNLSKAKDSVFINFFSINEKVPEKLDTCHFRFPVIGPKLLSNMMAILELLKYELSDMKFKIHFGWPLSSWIDRISIGVMVYTIMRLPKRYPDYEFFIEYNSTHSLIGKQIVPV